MSFKKLHVLSRPYNDTFTFPMFESLISRLDCDYTAYYTWSCPPKKLEVFLTTTDFSKNKNVIIGIKDLLDMWLDYNYWEDSAQAGARLIDRTAGKFPNTNFVICTSVENLHKEKFNNKNIQIIYWGGDLVNQLDHYKNCKPVLDKNLNSDKHFICLNRNSRDHRIVLLSYLFGLGYDKFGKITFIGTPESWVCNTPNDDTNTSDKFMDKICWRFDESQSLPDITEKILNGFANIIHPSNGQLAEDDYLIYKTEENDNLYNFETKLRDYYKNSVVELVTESSFSSPGFLLTEKTMHSIYGCNFPIIFSGAGAIDHLRSVGLDMFDDIVDHSYDKIQNPFDRLITAVNSNKKLLTDSVYAKQKWQQAKSRFESNVNVVNTQLLPWYLERAESAFKKINWKI